MRNATRRVGKPHFVRAGNNVEAIDQRIVEMEKLARDAGFEREGANSTIICGGVDLVDPISAAGYQHCSKNTYCARIEWVEFDT